MDHHSEKHLQCVVVTPEQAVLDETTDFVAVPMLDGELGVLPGRAPLIGRLGTGDAAVCDVCDQARIFVVSDDADRCGEPGGRAALRADRDRPFVCVLLPERVG